MIQNFFDRGTALLTVLPDRHNVIACISSASQFNILEANKVKRLVIVNKTYRPFSFTSPPNSIALIKPLKNQRLFKNPFLYILISLLVRLIYVNPFYYYFKLFITTGISLIALKFQTDPVSISLHKCFEL